LRVRWAASAALRAAGVAERAAKAAVAISLPLLGSCTGAVSRSGVLSFLEAIQRPFHLGSGTWLGIPVAWSAHFITSALLAGVLARVWRPKAAAILVVAMILAKEIMDLAIIALYQPVTWSYASNSVMDVVVSVAGVWLGLWVTSRVTGRPVQDESRRSS
jgi:hypothetical protein